MKPWTKEELDKAWPRIRAHLYMRANGATRNYDPKMGIVKQETKQPPNRHRDISDLERDWAKAYSRSRKEQVIWDAMIYLWLDSPPMMQEGALPHMPEKVRDQLRKLVIHHLRDTLEWKQAIAFYRHPISGDFEPLRKVAKVFGISHETVRKYRKQFAGLDAS